MVMLVVALVTTVLLCGHAVSGQGTVFDGCGCGAAVATFSQVTSAYCPTTQYTTCDISKLVSSNCIVTCDGGRSQLTFRNATALWIAYDSITCANGEYRTNSGLKITNLMRPTCGIKNACDNCNIAHESTCPSGFTCNEANLIRSTAADGCSRMTCAEGSLKVYDATTKESLPFTGQQLYCTVLNQWSNYSLDGSITGGTRFNMSITANCALSANCESCSTPKIATSLAQLPTTFHTGYSITPGYYNKTAGACSTVTCPSGYTLYGFNGNATNVTGKEYTSFGYLKCQSLGYWANGGMAIAPLAMLSACLKQEHACTCAFGLGTCAAAATYGRNNTLITKQPLTAGVSCNLTCPAGKRMVVTVANDCEDFYYMQGGITCDGTSWNGKLLLSNETKTLVPAQTAVTCENDPFPAGFAWPLKAMEQCVFFCYSEDLIYDSGVVKCRQTSTKLIVSTSRNLFVSIGTMANISYTGTYWTGADASTGQTLTFPANVYMTCYYDFYGGPATVQPNTTTAAATTTKPATTTTTAAPTTTTVATTSCQPVCECNYKPASCSDPSQGCDSSLIQVNGCVLSCPAGKRLIGIDNPGEIFTPLNATLTCATNWLEGPMWSTTATRGFYKTGTWLTCETHPFPAGFNWPFKPDASPLGDMTKLYLDDNKIKCRSGYQLTTTEIATNETFEMNYLSWNATSQEFEGTYIMGWLLHFPATAVKSTCFATATTTTAPPATTTTAPPVTTTTAATPTTFCECNYKPATCSDPSQGCDSSLVQVNGCVLSCPAGKRLIGIDNPGEIFTPLNATLTCGTSWLEGPMWSTTAMRGFYKTGTWLTCETHPFPAGFNWPFKPDASPLGDMTKLYLDDNKIKCRSGYQLTSTDIATNETFEMNYLTWNATSQEFEGTYIMGWLLRFSATEIKSTCFATATTTTAPPATTTTASTAITVCDCNYKPATCSDPSQGCDSSLIQVNGCVLSCPVGKRMIGADTAGGVFTPLNGSASCEAEYLGGPIWSTSDIRAFYKTGTFITCETHPFPAGFNWPIYPDALSGADRSKLYFDDNKILCRAGYQLQVRETATNETFEMNYLTWNVTSQEFEGTYIMGWLLHFPSSAIRATCFATATTTAAPPVTTTTIATTTTPAATTTAAATTTDVCGCALKQHMCTDPSLGCNPTQLVTSGCTVTCPANTRLVATFGSGYALNRMASLTCTSTKWGGVMWSSPQTMTTTAGTMEAACEVLPFPTGFSYPMTILHCENDCLPEKLFYADAKLQCQTGWTLWDGDNELEHLEWDASINEWKGPTISYFSFWIHFPASEMGSTCKVTV